jgi:outer membrane protein OmpU
MKKLLIASTALVATAGMAAAEVSLSGYAEMGIKDNGTDTVFHHDLDVKFSLSGETDNGLTFGATIDLDEVSGGISSESGPHAVWIKGGFGNLTMGDTDGAMDFVNTEIGMLTSIADDHTTHAGYWGGTVHDGSNDGQILRYDNTFGDFGVALSYEMDDSGAGNDVMQVGVKYAADLGGANIALGLGYSEDDTSDAFSISAKTSISGVDAVVNYVDGDFGDYMGLGLGYTVGDWSMTVNYGEYDFASGDDADGFGVAVNYSLGGGAVVMAGYGDSSATIGGVSASADTWSLGLGLSF